MGLIAMTGGATGIGAAVKEQLLAHGQEVLVVDLKDADIIADLSTADGRAVAIEGIHAAAPQGINGFVPCAGVGPATKPASLITRINYFGALATIEGLRDLISVRNGAIVVISSNSAPMGADQTYVDALLAGNETEACRIADEIGDGQNAYGGGKLALTRWMRRNAPTYATEGVRMNAVAPGLTQTPLTDAVMADSELGPFIKSFGETIPTGQIGQPRQIAEAIVFLLSEAADFICGSVLFADGGHDAMLRPDEF
jgi:NAD(P)-dependent dehydrogenase (short-subunit alcohol dehydrogenase family)